VQLTAARAGSINIRMVQVDRPKRSTRRKASQARVARAKYAVGQVVKHRFYPFRGVIFDIDPVFNNTEEWWLSIPEDIRPRKDQPFYHLLAENAETEYIAYVSEQNLLPDNSGVPVRHPKVSELFREAEDGHYEALFLHSH
jgi:heat shock protein HspQ